MHPISALFARDFRMFRRKYFSRLFDSFLLVLLLVTVFAYIMPAQGLDDGFGVVILAGSIASFGFFDVISRVGEMAADIEGDQVIKHMLILPMPAYQVFFHYVIFWSFVAFSLTVPIFFFGKLLLWNQFDLSKVNFLRVGVMYIVMNIFYGSLALWLTSLVRGMDVMQYLWMRVLNPLLSIGGFFFTWKALHEVSPIISYVAFLDPVLYCMEGIRSAMIGPEGFLPFWYCVLAIIGFTSVCMWDATRRLKKKLDAV